MSEENTLKQKKADDMKALRRTCKERIEQVSALVKEQKKSLKALRAELENTACTVQELATATGMATDVVLWYVAAMKKFGKIAEMEKDEGYYRYALIAAKEVMNDE